MSSKFIKVHDCTQLPPRVCESSNYYDNGGLCELSSLNDCQSNNSSKQNHTMMVVMIDKINDVQSSIDDIKSRLDRILS